MAIKYISKNKDGKWKVSATKTGTAVRVYPTQKEAIIYASTMKDVEAIMVKRESGWVLDSSWNNQVKKEAIKKVEAKKNKGKTHAQAKNEVVNEIISQEQKVKTSKKTKLKNSSKIFLGIIITILVIGAFIGIFFAVAYLM